MHPDDQGLAAHEEFSRQDIDKAERDFAAAGVVRYVALHDGVIAGGAGLRIAEGLAQLTGAATAPAHRRRGVQSALLGARLADAAAAGCDVAVVTTQPASKSQENVQRRGFDLLYTRAVLVRQPEAALATHQVSAPLDLLAPRHRGADASLRAIAVPMRSAASSARTASSALAPRIGPPRTASAKASAWAVMACRNTFSPASPHMKSTRA